MVSPGGLRKSIPKGIAGSRLVCLAWENPRLYRSSPPADTPFLLAAILKNLLPTQNSSPASKEMQVLEIKK